MHSLAIEKTQDGSATLYHKELDEHYHSSYGARAETQHIFIEHALLQQRHRSTITLLEIGFGTGLNALMTLLAQKNGICSISQIHYITYELYPLTPEIVKAYTASLPEGEERTLYCALHAASWDSIVEISPAFRLEKRMGDARQLIDAPSLNAEVIYMDAFSPNSCPELWSADMLQALYKHTAPGGVLSTYCAKGVVRRALQATGFEVTRTPGPVGGKREILVCHKEG